MTGLRNEETTVIFFDFQREFVSGKVLKNSRFFGVKVKVVLKKKGERLFLRTSVRKKNRTRKSFQSQS